MVNLPLATDYCERSRESRTGQPQHGHEGSTSYTGTRSDSCKPVSRFNAAPLAVIACNQRPFKRRAWPGNRTPNVWFLSQSCDDRHLGVCGCNFQRPTFGRSTLTTKCTRAVNVERSGVRSLRRMIFNVTPSPCAMPGSYLRVRRPKRRLGASRDLRRNRTPEPTFVHPTRPWRIAVAPRIRQA